MNNYSRFTLKVLKGAKLSYYINYNKIKVVFEG